MDPKGPDIGPYARAIEWVAKITTVGLMMTLPVVAGRYLDQRWDTNYWVLAGLGFGMTAGMWQLLQMTRPKKSVKRKSGDSSGA